MAIAFVVISFEALLPIPIIGSSVIALFIVLFLNTLKKSNEKIKIGLVLTSKKILKFSITLLGASLSIKTILTVELMSLAVMFFTLRTCFGGGYFIGKWLGLD